MTDFASRDPDQLASDLVDGLLPPDEAARLRADPEVAARVARIEALRSALRSTPPAPPPAGALDRMVAAAVQAAAGAGAASGSADPVDSADPADPGSAPRHLQPVPPPRHHARPTPRARSVRPWLAAAAVLVGLAMAGLLTRGGSDADSEDMATSSAAEERAGSSEDEGATYDDSGGSGAGSLGTDEPAAGDPQGPNSADGADGEAEEDSGAEVGAGVDVLSADLGAVDSADELADRVRAERAAAGDAPPPVSATEASCPGHRPQGDVARGTSTYTAEAEYRGEPVTVHVYENGDGARLVATDASCTDVVDVPYED